VQRKPIPLQLCWW